MRLRLRRASAIDRTEKWSTDFSWEWDWSEAVLRSALAPTLLIYSPTGSIGAAVTTSIPESRAGSKNWDYRFARVRDLA